MSLNFKRVYAMRRFFLKISIVAVLLPLPTISLAGVPNDFDGDGISDIVTLTPQSGSSLRWIVTASSTGTTALDEVFGLTTDVPMVQDWDGDGLLNIGVVRPQAGKAEPVWKSLRTDKLIDDAEFGRVGDVIFSGVDFDQNGVGDQVIVRATRDKKPLTWQVRFNPFLLEGKKETKEATKKISFGREGDRAFVFNPTGSEQVIAVFGVDKTKKKKKGKKKKKKTRSTARVLFRSVSQKEKTKIAGLPVSLARREDRPRPQPFRSPDGTDYIAFVTNDATDTTLEIFDLDGERVSRHSFPGVGSSVIGEYNSATSGDEFVLNVSTLITFNPFSEVRIDSPQLSGSLFSSFHVGAVGSS